MIMLLLIPSPCWRRSFGAPCKGLPVAWDPVTVAVPGTRRLYAESELGVYSYMTGNVMLSKTLIRVGWATEICA
jgi:hypothetical protein